MAKIKCKRSVYKKKPVDELDNFAEEVEDGVYTHNPPLTTPPYTQVVFHAFITTYDSARAAYTAGGSAQKGAFETAKENLIEALDKMADYVDEVADGDQNIITDAGFVPTKGTASSAVKPGMPIGITVKRGNPLEIITTSPKVAGVNTYGCIVVENGPLPENITLNQSGQLVFNIADFPPPGPVPQITALGIDLTEQREKHITALTHDAIYYIYYYYVNSAGVSPLSEPVIIVCW